VRLFGETVTALPPWERVRRGLGRSFQVSSVFRLSTVLENVQTGLMLARGQAWNMIGNAAATLRSEAEAVLEKVDLGAKRHLPAGDLSYGDQRTLELAVALSTNPRILLLDEPTAGMNPAETLELAEQIKTLHDQGLSILIIEHKLDVVTRLADKVVVLDHGEKLTEGTPDAVRRNEDVLRAYLGRAATEAANAA
jgi:branched-chain amino acid transport system ATP-binding protein